MSCGKNALTKQQQEARLPTRGRLCTLFVASYDSTLQDTQHTGNSSQLRENMPARDRTGDHTNGKLPLNRTCTGDASNCRFSPSNTTVPAIHLSFSLRSYKYSSTTPCKPRLKCIHWTIHWGENVSMVYLPAKHRHPACDKHFEAAVNLRLTLKISCTKMFLGPVLLSVTLLIFQHLQRLGWQCKKQKLTLQQDLSIISPPTSTSTANTAVTLPILCVAPASDVRGPVSFLLSRNAATYIQFFPSCWLNAMWPLPDAGFRGRHSSGVKIAARPFSVNLDNARRLSTQHLRA